MFLKKKIICHMVKKILWKCNRYIVRLNGVRSMSKIEINCRNQTLDACYLIIRFETLAWISQRGSHLNKLDNNKCDVLLFSIQIFLHREGKEHVWTCCMFILSFTFGVITAKVFSYTMKRETSYYIYSYTKSFYAQWVFVVYTSCQYENKNHLL